MLPQQKPKCNWASFRLVLLWIETVHFGSMYSAVYTCTIFLKNVTQWLTQWHTLRFIYTDRLFIVVWDKEISRYNFHSGGWGSSLPSFPSLWNVGDLMNVDICQISVFVLQLNSCNISLASRGRPVRLSATSNQQYLQRLQPKPDTS